METKPLRFLTALVLAAAALAQGAAAAPPAPAPLTLVLKDHRFTPSTLTVPAGQKLQIVVINQDKATEEFDSHDLKIEKLITPNSRATIKLGPLKPGTYRFMGEFHPATAQGQIIAIAAKP